MTALKIVPLPSTAKEIAELRKPLLAKTLAEAVAPHVEALLQSDYARFLSAVTNAEAEEGHLRADDYRCCDWIQTRAKQKGDDRVATAKWEAIRRAVNSVLTHKFVDNLSRKGRKKAAETTLALTTPAE